MKFSLAMVGWIMMCIVGTVAAQSSMLPQPCSGKTGDTLRDCVRQITPPERVQRLEPNEIAPDPSQPVNCLKVYPTDRNFCIQRNEIIIECRNKLKHPDFNQCFAQYVSKVPAPRAQDCGRVSLELTKRCEQRSVRFDRCVPDPLHYFACLSGIVGK